jgi:hypothetical protein
LPGLLAPPLPGCALGPEEADGANAEPVPEAEVEVEVEVEVVDTSPAREAAAAGSVPFARARRGVASGAARTTVREPPTASGSDSGGESEPRVTKVGNVTAAASAVPATAAAAMMVRLRLTRSPVFADPLKNGIGEISGQPELRRINCRE